MYSSHGAVTITGVSSHHQEEANILIYRVRVLHAISLDNAISINVLTMRIYENSVYCGIMTLVG